MDKSWKVFQSESGLCSLENRGLEERSFYRMKVFLKNFYKEDYREEGKEQGYKSFLYSIAMNLRGKDALTVRKRTAYRPDGEHDLRCENCREQKNGNSCSLGFYVGLRKFLLTWDEVLGLVITAEDRMGNDLITSLGEELEKETYWF